MDGIIILSGSELQTLMPFGAYVEAVAEGFRMFAEGRAASPLPLHIPAQDGGFHVKAATLSLARSYAAIKTNANFPRNRQRAGLPTIQGAILLFDATDGTPPRPPRSRFSPRSWIGNRGGPANLWVRCGNDRCKELIYVRELEKNLRVCPTCGHHFRLSAEARLEMLLDGGTWRERDAGLQSVDPLGFVDQKPYPERVATAQSQTGLRDAAVRGTGAIEGRPV